MTIPLLLIFPAFEHNLEFMLPHDTCNNFTLKHRKFYAYLHLRTNIRWMIFHSTYKHDEVVDKIEKQVFIILLNFPDKKGEHENSFWREISYQFTTISLEYFLQ